MRKIKLYIDDYNTGIKSEFWGGVRYKGRTYMQADMSIFGLKKKMVESISKRHPGEVSENDFEVHPLLEGEALLSSLIL